jgi:hypothetical protein
MNLIDDHRLDAAQGLPSARGEQEEERLRRGDEDVRGRSNHLRALAPRRVAGAHTHRGQVKGNARFQSVLRDACDRHAEIFFDVDAERFQRRDVEHAAPLALVWRGLEHDSVQRCEERGERFSRAGRRQKKQRTADRGVGKSVVTMFEAARPSRGLGVARSVEGRSEPSANRSVEPVQNVAFGGWHGHGWAKGCDVITRPGKCNGLCRAASEIASEQTLSREVNPL